MSYTGIYIKTGILQEKNPFSWKVLGIDESGNVMYAYSENILGDNLWNHTATGNIKMWTHLISYSWIDNKWVRFDTDNNFNATQKIKTMKTIQIGDAWQGDCLPSNGGEIRFISNCFQWCDGTSRKDITWSGCNWATNNACLGTLPTYAISTSIGSIPGNTYRNYATTAWACTYICNAGFAYNSSTHDCVATTIERACEWLPAHASWNTTNTISQNRDGTTYIPSNIWTYNITPSTTECRFTCDEWFLWENNTCVEQTPINQCLWTLPANTINTSLENNWTWNFDLTSGKCTFICAANYSWNGNLCTSYISTSPLMTLKDLVAVWNNLYFWGEFKDRLHITNIIDTAIEWANAYIANVSIITKELQWINHIHANSTQNHLFISQVITDNIWNTYVAGEYMSGIILWNITLTGSVHLRSAFVAKLNTSWKRVWAKKAVGTYNTFQPNNHSLYVDTDNNLYAVWGFIGWWNGNNYVDSVLVTGYDIAFVAKINPQGTIVKISKIINNLYKDITILNDANWWLLLELGYGNQTNRLLRKMDLNLNPIVGSEFSIPHAGRVANVDTNGNIYYKYWNSNSEQIIASLDENYGNNWETNIWSWIYTYDVDFINGGGIICWSKNEPEFLNVLYQDILHINLDSVWTITNTTILGGGAHDRCSAVAVNNWDTYFGWNITSNTYPLTSQMGLFLSGGFTNSIWFSFYIIQQ